jgi:hypothetical protein
MTNLPAPLPDKFKAIWNNRLNKYEIIDVATGDLLPFGVHAPERISVYCQQTVDIILARVREGETLRKICGDPTMPSYSALYAWRARFPEFRQALDSATEDRAGVMHDRVLELAELAIVEERDKRDGIKIAIDAYKWSAERGDRKRYGSSPSAQVESGGFTIVLNTGVLETPSPKNVVVDINGNFQGFTDEQDGMGSSERSEHVGRRECSERIDEATFQEAGGDGPSRQEAAAPQEACSESRE